MATFSTHLYEQSVRRGCVGIHGDSHGPDGSGWVTLSAGRDEIVIHADDVLQLCTQLEQAARDARASLCEEIRQRDEQIKSS